MDYKKIPEDEKRAYFTKTDRSCGNPFTAAFVTVSLPGMINGVYAYDINNKAITGLGAGAISNPDPKQPGSWCYVYYGRENGMERK